MKIGFLDGKKTYIVVLAMLAGALASALSSDGTVDVQTFLGSIDWQFVLTALGIGALRRGVKTGA